MKMLNYLAGMAVLVLCVGNTFAFAEDLDGPAVYQKHCASCHGDKLQGGIGSSFLDHVWNYGSHPGLIGMNIKFGIPNLEMPAWKDQLSDAEIKAVTAYIVEQDAASSEKMPPQPTYVSTEKHDLKIELMDDNLDEPWAIAFIDHKTAFVTDKGGKLFKMVYGKVQKQPIKGTPEDIVSSRQGGLLDVAIDPDYKKNGWVYLSYSHILKNKKAMTRIVRGHIQDGQWTDQQVIFQASKKHYSKTRHHYGSRITFDDNGYLYFSVGDRGAMEQAQDLARPNGKIHRIHTDGSIPKDNPFIDHKGAMPSLFSYGNRNPQGMDTHPVTGEIWAAEHGPMGGDELNHIRAGVNYGWPEITYGLNYDGSKITDYTEKPGMEQPVIHWTPSIAVADIDFYQGKRFPKWQNNLLVTSLKYRDLRRLVIEDGKVTHQEILLKGVGRIRSVTVGPDGAIYLLLKDPAKILRITPK